MVIYTFDKITLPMLYMMELSINLNYCKYILHSCKLRHGSTESLILLILINGKLSQLDQLHAFHPLQFSN